MLVLAVGQATFANQNKHKNYKGCGTIVPQQKQIHKTIENRQAKK